MEPLGPSGPADTSSLQPHVHHFAPPLQICPLKHFCIPNSFFSNCCFQQNMWTLHDLAPGTFSSLISCHDPLWSHWPFSVFQMPTSFPPQACYLLLCFLPGLILPAALLLTVNASFRSLLSWFPEILLIRKHNYSL